jgi:hypothetical protein
LELAGKSSTLGRMPKRGRIYVNRSLSFPPQLLAAARERAAKLGLAFSAYVRKCVELDLAKGGPLVFDETSEPRRKAAEPAGSVADSPKGASLRKS